MRWSHSNNLLRHPLSAPILLVTVVLAVYYPALLIGIHPVDDPGLFAKYSASPPLSNILLPGNSYYYRPIVELSFYLDSVLWGMEPVTMHMENILLHCGNTLLVYLLARKIYNDDETPVIPLLAALLFALHPVNVEAVAWIAGRTDPLLALFVLSAGYFWLRWLDKPRWSDMLATMLLFCTALLTKESALAFGAVLILLAMICPGAATGRQRLSAVCLMVAPGLMLVMFALFFRSGSSAISRFVSGTDFHAAKSVWDALVALGFYVKKMVFPFPLNFAVNSVHPLYGLLGVALFPLFWLAFRRNRLSGILFISAALFILPAILVAVKQIAWTPYAERYLYLPMAFFTPGLVGIGKTWRQKQPKVLMSFLVLLLCASALGTHQRNLLWKDSLSFFQDAVAKSPEFGSVYHSLGGELMKKGEIDLAAEAFATADRLNQRDSIRYQIKSSIMGTILAKGKYLEARIYFFQLFKKKQDAPVEFIEMLCKADSKRLETVYGEGKVLLARDLIETLEILYQKRANPFLFYQSGKMALIAGNSDEAADFFRRAYVAAPVDAHYKAAAKTYYLRLEAGK